MPVNRKRAVAALALAVAWDGNLHAAVPTVVDSRGVVHTLYSDTFHVRHYMGPTSLAW